VKCYTTFERRGRMESSMDQTKSDINRPGFMAIFHAARRMARWLIKFFELTEEDLWKAGISYKSDKHQGE
jgi:hypothetical protein